MASADEMKKALLEIANLEKTLKIDGVCFARREGKHVSTVECFGIVKQVMRRAADHFENIDSIPWVEAADF